VSKRATVLRGLTLAACATCAAALPASASATTLFVSPSAPSAPFNSCAHPAYSHIQEAVRGPGTAIHVCPGTYAEQLTIERAVAITGYGGATVKLPAVTTNSTSPCDAASQAGDSLPDQDAVSICTAGKVTIKSLNIEAIWPGNPIEEGESCAFNLYGVLVAGGADVELAHSNITGARPHVLNGCQYGVGIQVGMSYATPEQPGTAKLVSDTVSGYDKNGITVDGVGSQATITKATVTGAGEIPQTAQNGIGVQLGATATITSSTISGNECDLTDEPPETPCGANAMADYQATGVYFYEAAAGSSLAKSTLEGNDVGAEGFDSSSADPVIKYDTFEDDRYESVQISQGSATVANDVMKHSNVGIQLLQFAEGPFGAQAYGDDVTATNDTIEHMNDWAVLGRSDKNAKDMSGEISITHSKISGNPGPRPLESVESENPTKLKIFAEKDS
jgi:nitrous oxidase accessory protein NosD